MTRDEVIDEYFEWLFDIVCHDRYSKQISYRKLLMFLHDTKFRWILPMDENRADAGVGLRYRFAMHNGYENHVNRVLGYLERPCSVLELMVALSITIENDIMDDPSIGDRTGQWFWQMIVSLGLGSMTDRAFDKKEATDIIERFLNREHASNGRGSLFTIKHCPYDLRDLEIWAQMCWYLDSIV